MMRQKQDKGEAQKVTDIAEEEVLQRVSVDAAEEAGLECATDSGLQSEGDLVEEEAVPQTPSKQDLLEAATARAVAARDEIIRIDSAINELSRNFPPAKVEVARMRMGVARGSPDP